MRSDATPRSSKKSATAPKELPDSPGPSSATAKRAAGSANSSDTMSSDKDNSRRNGCPTGRRVTGGGASTAAATSAPSAVPMLRMPITFVRPPKGSPAARAATR